MIDEIKRRGALANRKKFIEELTNVPPEIKGFHKANKKLTTTERFISAFLLACIRYGYVKSYRTQQIIQMGSDGNYIMADFFLHWPEVIIEVDGPEHSKSRDYERDAKVKDLFAYTTIRVTNAEVTSNKESNLKVRERLIRELAEAEGLNKNQVRLRVKDFFRRQKEEGL